MSNRDKVEDEWKKCRALEASWHERADQYYGKEGAEMDYARSVGRAAIYGTVANHLQQILDEWEEEGVDRK